MEPRKKIFYHPKNLHVAELVSMLNIFDDVYIKKHDEEAKITVLESGNLRLKIKSLSSKTGNKVSWGIHPENRTLLLLDSGSVLRMKTFILHVSIVSSIKDQKNELHLNLLDITRL